MIDLLKRFEIAYPAIYNRKIEAGYIWQDHIPEDRMPMPPCRFCGRYDIVYAIKDWMVEPHCVYCGVLLNISRKKTSERNHRQGNPQKKLKDYMELRYGTTCALCDETKGLHIHHIIPYKTASETDGEDELCYMANNCILLCEKHHHMAHKQIKIKYIKKIKEGVE